MYPRAGCRGIQSAILSHMDIASALREIDAVIGRLQEARAILSGEDRPARIQRRRIVELRSQPPTALPAAAVPPQVTVLPPKVKRSYRRTARRSPSSLEPRSLSSTIPTAPVFVPKAATPDVGVEWGGVQAQQDTDSIEAAGHA